MSNNNTDVRATFPASTGQVNGATTVMLKDGQSTPATVKISVPKSKMSNRKCVIRASGYFTAVSGNQTILIKAVADDGVQTAPTTSAATFASSGALAAANPSSFCLEFHFVADPVNDVVRGFVVGWVGDVVVTYAIGTVASFDPDLAWIFGVALTSGTSATVVLKNLDLDLL